MELQVKIIGILFMILATIHIIFPKYFNWKEELISLSLINRQMMIIHTLFVALTVFLMGLLCVYSADQLINTSIGKTISLGFAIFWTLRLIVQFFGYSSKLWKGKRFETSVHVVFSIFWLYVSTIFWLNYLV